MEGIRPGRREQPSDQLKTLSTEELLDKKTFEELHRRIALMNPEHRAQMQEAIDKLTAVIAKEGVGGLEALDKIVVGASSLSLVVGLIAWATGGPLLGLIGAVGQSLAAFALPNQKAERVSKRLHRLSGELKRYTPTQSGRQIDPPSVP